MPPAGAGWLVVGVVGRGKGEAKRGVCRGGGRGTVPAARYTRPHSSSIRMHAGSWRTAGVQPRCLGCNLGARGRGLEVHSHSTCCHPQPTPAVRPWRPARSHPAARPPPHHHRYTDRIPLCSILRSHLMPMAPRPATTLVIARGPKDGTLGTRLLHTAVMSSAKRRRSAA